MPHYLPIESWPRRDHFFFFKEYEHPFFNICADVHVARLRRYLEETGGSFFLATLFLSLKAINELEPFRYRLRNDRVLVHDVIHGGSTVLNQDDTFSFFYFDYYPKYSLFHAEAEKKLAYFKSGEKCMNPRDQEDDLIHYSVLPWVSFTSFAHARKHNNQDSVPKVVFGKYRKEGGKVKMPVSVEVHHALMDGLHVGRFFQSFEAFLNDPVRFLV